MSILIKYTAEASLRPTVVGEADLSGTESLGEIESVSFRELFSPTFDSKRGIHKGENVEGRKNAACLLFCERNLSPCAALFGYFLRRERK